jgi:SAM-dependent methyltransferase
MTKYNVGLNPNEENEAGAKIVRLISKESVILEFGPAYGRMTRYLKENLHCSVYIVEQDKAAYAEALKYAVDGICGDISDLKWAETFKNIHFDFIIFADVLEHLHDPYVVVSKAVKLLKDNGSILISVPNISHNDILVNLYQNKFEYTQIGLLDKDHIHFFTYHTLQKLAYETGLIIKHIDAVTVNIGKTEQKVNLNEVPEDFYQSILNHAYGNVYQFVCSLQKGEWDNSKTFNKLTGYGNLISAIHYDIGEGFMEEPLLASANFNHERNNYFISFNIPEGCLALRFDPIESPCKVKVISAETNDGNIMLKAGNADLTEDGFDFFSTPDPIYYVVSPDTRNIRTVKITWEMYDLRDNDYKKLVDILSKKNYQLREERDINISAINSLKNQVQAYDKEFKEKDKIINQMYQTVEKMQNQLQEYDSIFKQKDKDIKELIKSYDIHFKEKDKFIKDLYEVIDELQKQAINYDNMFIQKDKDIASLNNRISELETIIKEKEDHLEWLKNEKEVISLELTQLIDDKNKTIKSLTEKLQKIYDSKFWNLFRIINKINE